MLAFRFSPKVSRVVHSPGVSGAGQHSLGTKISLCISAARVVPRMIKPDQPGFDAALFLPQTVGQNGLGPRIASLTLQLDLQNRQRISLDAGGNDSLCPFSLSMNDSSP